jgi:hypothetical protein
LTISEKVIDDFILRGGIGILANFLFDHVDNSLKSISCKTLVTIARRSDKHRYHVMRVVVVPLMKTVLESTALVIECLFPANSGSPKRVSPRSGVVSRTDILPVVDGSLSPKSDGTLASEQAKSQLDGQNEADKLKACESLSVFLHCLYIFIQRDVFDIQIDLSSPDNMVFLQ